MKQYNARVLSAVRKILEQEGECLLGNIKRDVSGADVSPKLGTPAQSGSHSSLSEHTPGGQSKYRSFELGSCIVVFFTP